MIHIIKGHGSPEGVIPPSTGVHYIDVDAKDTYLSVGTNSSTDWVLQGGSGTSFTNFLALLDTPTSYTEQDGKVPMVDEDNGILVFDNEKLIQLKDVNDSGLSDNMVFVYDFADGETFKPQYRMDWKDNWAAGTYKTNSVVKDQGWVMISNKETTDRAAPQPDGNSAWALSDSPTWQAGQTSPIAIQGLRFTIASEVVTLDGFRAWRATDTGNESYSYVIQDLTDENNPTLITSGTLPQGPVGWVDITSSGRFFYEGQVIDIKFATEVSTSSSTWTHTWTLQDAVGGVPASGTYTHNADHTLLRISVDADGPSNVKGDLDQLKVGDTLLMFEFLSASRFNDYQVASAPSYSNGDTFLELPVVRIGNGQSIRTGVLSQGDATIKAGSLPASYTSIPNYWYLNPPVGGGAVNGYLINDWNAEPDLNDDALGLDIRGHGWVVSDDWDVITTIGSGGSGGGGTGVDEFRQLVDTPNSYFDQGSKYVAVKEDETGLEFIEGGGGVTSFNQRVGDVVPGPNDYSASQVGAYTKMESDTNDTASIAAHVGEANPHPQYLTGADLPSIVVSYFTGIASVIDANYLLKSAVILGNVENTVSATSTNENEPVLIGQWLADPVFQEDGTLLETGSDFTLDYEASADFTDLRIEVGIRSTLGVYTTIAQQDFSVNQGQSVSTFTVTVPETDYLAGETSFSRMYVIKRESGGSKQLTIYQEGSYVSRTLTTIPVASLPAPHAASHEVGGSDQVDHNELTNAKGYSSHSQIDFDLSDHEGRIGVNESDIVPLQQNSPPSSGKIDGRYLSASLSGCANDFTITDFGIFDTDGTFRFTQFSSQGLGQGLMGDAVISGSQLSSISLVRNAGYGYFQFDVITLDIPDAGQILPAKVFVNNLVVGQEWKEITGGGGGGTFDSLTDTPASKAGFKFHAPFVDAAEGDLEYRKVQSELTADLNLTVDFAAGAEIEGSVYLTTQAAWDYQAQFKADSAETYTVTITTINCASITDMADMALDVLSGQWSHVTMFWPGTQVCNPAATIWTGTLYNFSNCTTPNFDGREQSMDLDLSNRVRRTISYSYTTARIVGKNNTTDAFVIRNGTYSTGTGGNDVAVRARNFSTVSADFLWVLGNNNRGASCDESLMSLNNAKLLGREYGFYTDAMSSVAAINGPSFDDGSTLVPDSGSVDVFIASGATCNFVNAVWSGSRDVTNLLTTINIPMPEGVLYTSGYLTLQDYLFGS